MSQKAFPASISVGEPLLTADAKKDEVKEAAEHAAGEAEQTPGDN